MELAVNLGSLDRKLELFGSGDSHLRLLREAFNVKITARHENLIILGKETDVQKTAQAIDRMQKHLTAGNQLTDDDVKAFINQPDDTSLYKLKGKKIEVYSGKKLIEPHTAGQLKYIEKMLSNDLTFCTGPAGTGKTYLAVAVAVSMLKKKQIRRIVLARPAVEAGEKLGFLPGDIQAKVNPYLRPLFDALEDMMGFAQMKKFMEL
ncbi:MAG: PhoH family protein, partial [Planctomycetota bacterium]